MIGLIASLVLPVLAFYVRDPWVWTAITCLWLSYAAWFAGSRCLRNQQFCLGWAILGPLALAAAGLVQLLWRITVNRDATWSEVWLWTALSVLFLTARTILRDPETLERFLRFSLAFGTAIAVLCLVQFYTSKGLIYWLIPTDQAQVWGPFRNRNHLAAFLELVIPPAATRAVTDRKHQWEFAALTAILVAPVLLGGSRAGIALIVIELTLILWIAGFRIPAAAAIFAGLLILGWHFQARDSGHRLPLNASALEMARAQPLLGFGLGTFETVYPAYAFFDNGLIVDHAHNDWLELASEAGGLAILPLIGVALWAGRRALRTPWAMGLPAIFLHAIFDYPLHKPALAAWTFVMVAALSAGQRQPRPSEQH